jgi:hypothetical protein
MTNDYRSLDCPAARSPAPNGYSRFRRLVLWTPSLLPLLFRARPTPAEPVSLRRPSLQSLNEPRAIPSTLQQWDYEAGNAATSFAITREDIAIATVRAIRQLDFSFFRLRFDRLTGREKDFLFSMLRRWWHPARFRRYCRTNGRQSKRHWPSAQHAHRQGHDLQSIAWRKHLYRPAF